MVYSSGTAHSTAHSTAQDGNMAKIFVTQETSYDFAPAEGFGTIEFITDQDLNNHLNSLHNVTLLKQIRSKLASFDPDKDFILPAGSPYVLAAVFMILGHNGVERIKILRWSNRDRTYQPLHIDFSFNKEIHANDRYDRHSRYNR